MDQVTAEGSSLENLSGLTCAEIAETLHNAREVFEQYHAEVRLGFIKKILKDPYDVEQYVQDEFVPGEAPQKEVATKKVTRRVTKRTTTTTRRFFDNETSEEEEIDYRKSSKRKYGYDKASDKEVVTEKASKGENDTKKTSEETVAEDVFTDDFGKDFTDDIFKYIAANSTEGLKVELEGQPRAQLSFLPLPYPSCSAEQATQGMGDHSGKSFYHSLN